MAEATARVLLGDGALVESAGIEAAQGMPATDHAVTVMAERGIDITGHRSRPIESVDLSLFDLVVAMTPSVASRLRILGVEDARLQAINVEDPYGKGLTAYRAAADDIERALRDVLLPVRR